MADKPQGSRRKRRGTAASEPDAATRPSTRPSTRPDAGGAQAPVRAPRVNARAYAEAMQQLRAFSEQRFEKLITAVAQGFFGMATREEVQRPELRAAFFAFFVLGYRDQNGVSILQMFRGYGFRPTQPQARALEALERATFRVVEITEKHEGSRQFEGVDILDGANLRFVDKRAFEALHPGDAIMAWFMASGEVLRPVEVATHVDALRLPGVHAALRSLAESAEVELAELSMRRPAQVFWTVYRGVNVGR